MYQTFLFSLSVLYFSCVYFSNCLLDPCSSKGAIGETCDRNSDCQGFGVVCTLGKCACHQDYQETQDDVYSPKYCVKLPDTIGQTCTTGCKFPMFCSTGVCSCIRAKVIDNQCFSDYQIGSECSRNFECTLPFTACIGGRCQCVEGTSVSGSVCIAPTNCPTGAKSKGVCVRTSGNKSLIQNLPNSGGKIDDCPDNHYCYTVDATEYGFCCPQVCPLSMQPANEYSCDPLATNQCPDDTHYCSRLAGQTFSSSVCCPKPCSDPTPLFIKGQCYPLAYLGGPCTVDEQCDGGYGMTCTNNVCVCSQGFKPYSDSFISGENPPQTCVRDCKSSSKPNAINYDGECFTASGLQQECTVNEQCPKNAICNRGLCICDCTKGFTTENGGCITPTTTTTANTTPKPLLGPISSSQNNLLTIIQNLLGTNKGG